MPYVINGIETYPETGASKKQVFPHRHRDTLCNYATADEVAIQKAINGAMKAKPQWESLPMEERCSVFLRAAEMLSVNALGGWREKLCAAVMVGQGKTLWQAEIDAAAETIDFWRFGAWFATDMSRKQPLAHEKGVWNRSEYRALDGFVAAISPFNFIAIGANLPSSPAIMGNCCLWKPAANAMYASWIIYCILKEAGLPDGVIQFVPADPMLFSRVVLKSKDLAGVHFTGSTLVFDDIMKKMAENVSNYRNYPRLVGETGGKNFHIIHNSADVKYAVYQTIRGAFEYQGQKCSATSRLFVAESLWESEFKPLLIEQVKRIKMGDPPSDFSAFMGPVINEKAYKRITGYIDRAKSSSNDECELIIGGEADDSAGYYISPTVVQVYNPEYESIREEIFGPLLSVYVYKDDDYEEMLDLIDKGTPYALTGAIFARDRQVIQRTSSRLKHCAGNFYVNDKCTGSIVGQQPFGGGRRSGTNDKSGSEWNLGRWVSPRSIKENFGRIDRYEYEHMTNDR